MPIDTIRIYHFTPLSVSLTLAWGQKASRKQLTMASVSAHFSIERDKMWYDEVTKV